MIFIDYINAAYAGETITSRKPSKSTGAVEFQTRPIPADIAKLDFSFYIDLDTKTSYSKEREKDAVLQLYQMERQYDSPIKMINELDVLDAYSLSNKEELQERYKLLSAQSSQAKAETIMRMNQAAEQYQIDPQLLVAAITEIVEGAKQTPATDAFMQQAQMMSQQVTTETQKSEEELAQQGIDPQFIEQAKQQLAQQGQTPNPTNLNLK
jgi:hypothetical protein